MRRTIRTLRRLATSLPVCFGLGIGGVEPASATLDEWGTFTAGDTRFCPEGVCGGDFIQQAQDGGLLQSASSVAFVPDDPATSPGNDFAAQATLVGALLLPELGVLAVAPVAPAVPPADPGRFISTASAEAVQGYAYVGSSPGTFTLDLFLSGTVTGFGSLTGFVGIYEEASFDRLGEFHGVRLANTTFLLEAGREIEPSPLVFTLDPGETFYVWAALFATADSRDATPSTADALHTLTLEFQDPSGLVPATPIPEPASGALLAFVLCTLGAAVRRRRQGSDWLRARP